MNIAVFHHSLDNIGGAEMVTLTIARDLQADVYTTNIDREKIAKMGFAEVTVKSIGKIPSEPPFRQQMALKRFSILDLRGKYDFFIIAGDWAVSAARYNQPNLWYVHSPAREVWDLYQYTRKHAVPQWKRPLFDVWVMYNRHLFRHYAEYVQTFFCNSLNTRRRIRRYLRKDAIILHPPIDTASYHYQKSENFWLSVNRLITHKRVMMQVEAFRQLPDERLIIVGSYERAHHFQRYARVIRRHAPPNIEIRSWVGSEELRNLYARCKGFITTSRDEDFGMAPVEAMASGKPVIAPREGGNQETIVAGKTGMLIDDITVEKLRSAIESFSDPRSYRKACLERAKAFDASLFLKQIQSHIEDSLGAGYAP